MFLKFSPVFLVCFLFFVFYVLFNNTLNTFLINGYIGVGNILIGKIPSGYLAGIDLRSTACQMGAYTTRLSRCLPLSYAILEKDKFIILFYKIVFFFNHVYFDLFRTLAVLSGSCPKDITIWSVYD